MERTGFSKLYRLALIAVVSNLALVALLSLSLTGEAQVFLPIVALALPLLTAAMLEARAKSASGMRQPTDARTRELPVFSTLKHAT